MEPQNGLREKESTNSLLKKQKNINLMILEAGLSSYLSEEFNWFLQNKKSR